MAEIKHLALRKFLMLKEKHGADYAMNQMTQKESDAIFDLILRNSVPENYHSETGGFIIREDA